MNKHKVNIPWKHYFCWEEWRWYKGHHRPMNTLKGSLTFLSFYNHFSCSLWKGGISRKPQENLMTISNSVKGKEVQLAATKTKYQILWVIWNSNSLRTKPQNHICPFFYPPTTFPGILQSEETETDFPLQEAKLDRVEPCKAYLLTSLFLTCRLECCLGRTQSSISLDTLVRTDVILGPGAGAGSWRLLLTDGRATPSLLEAVPRKWHSCSQLHADLRGTWH